MTAKISQTKRIAAALISGFVAFAAFFVAGCQDNNSHSGGMSKEQQMNFVKNNPKMSPEEKTKALQAIEKSGSQ